MKRIKVTIVFGLVLILFSCKKEFIELLPKSTVSVDMLYKTDKDYQDAVMGAYSVLQGIGSYLWQFGDMPGEDTEQQFVTSRTLVSLDYFFIDIDDGILTDSWNRSYNLINRCNTILTKIQNADASIVQNKDLYIGEASFLRALAYFQLVNIYGDVPFVTTPITPEESYKKGRESVDKIYKEIIIPDLLAAEKGLSLKYTGTNIGRATQGAAKSLLGKVYLYRKDFVNAEAKLREVTAMGYSLLPNFNDLWDYSKDEHHSEYIFDIEYEEGMSLGSGFTNTFCPGYQAVMNFFNIKGTGGSNGGPAEVMFTLFEPNDKRAKVTRAKGTTDVNGVYTPMPTFDAKTFCAKYMATTLKAGDSKVNWKLIRYADVLLMFAEALNENSKTTEALTNLNKIRTRAGATNYSGLTQSATREMIYLERRLELHLEGHRFFDLVRTGRALTVLQPFGIKEHMLIFPIPRNQVILVNNSTIFPQNPGYY